MKVILRRAIDLGPESDGTGDFLVYIEACVSLPAIPRKGENLEVGLDFIDYDTFLEIWHIEWCPKKDCKNILEPVIYLENVNAYEKYPGCTFEQAKEKLRQDLINKTGPVQFIFEK